MAMYSQCWMSDAGELCLRKISKTTDKTIMVTCAIF